MDQQNFQNLLDRYAKGEASEQEKARLDNWLNQSPSQPMPTAALIEKHLSSLDQRLGLETIKNRKLRLWPAITGIAASMLLILSIVLYNKFEQDKTNPITRTQSQILPGRSGAQLKLASGETINLDGDKKALKVNNSLTYQDGSELKNASFNQDHNVQPLEASTARGQLYSFTLADGTRVYLNAASSLNFPSRFEGANRTVQIKGEAYFEVAKDARHPFIVQTLDQQGNIAQNVEVLGTHFNINAYGDQGNIKTTLAEGKVKVSAGMKNLTLKPGEQAINGKDLSLQTADLNLELAWRSNKFAFRSARIDLVMTELSRWYNVEVYYQGKVPGSTFSGAISRDLTMQQALELLNFAGAKFSIEGRKIIVSSP